MAPFFSSEQHRGGAGHAVHLAVATESRLHLLNFIPIIMYHNITSQSAGRCPRPMHLEVSVDDTAVFVQRGTEADGAIR